MIFSIENIETGELRAQGGAITVFSSEPLARAHIASRSAAGHAAIDYARSNNPERWSPPCAAMRTDANAPCALAPGHASDIPVFQGIPARC